VERLNRPPAGGTPCPMRTHRSQTRCSSCQMAPELMSRIAATTRVALPGGVWLNSLSWRRQMGSRCCRSPKTRFTDLRAQVAAGNIMASEHASLVSRPPLSQQRGPAC